MIANGALRRAQWRKRTCDDAARFGEFIGYCSTSEGLPLEIVDAGMAGRQSKLDAYTFERADTHRLSIIANSSSLLGADYIDRMSHTEADADAKEAATTVRESAISRLIDIRDRQRREVRTDSASVPTKAL